MPANNQPNIHLAPQHLQRLTRSGVSEQVIKARMYQTAGSKSEIEKLGFSRSQGNAPALVIPMYDHLGIQIGVQIRPDRPRLNREGKPVKYESPKDSRSVIDIPPAARDKVLDLMQPLVITEGVIKADAAASKNIACVSISGVYAWKEDDPFWKAIPLKDRDVYIAFDSDQATNSNVQKAAARLCNEFRRHKAAAKVLSLPAGSNGSKQGLDDYLAAGHSSEDLFALSTLDVDALLDVETPETGGNYRNTPLGLVREIIKGDDLVIIPLTNFNALITADIEIDDGSGIRRELEITVDLNGHRSVIETPAEDFESMKWVLQKLGGNAIVHATMLIRDHARVAIQSVSGVIPRKKLYEHLGWVRIEKTWAFIHAGGAIGTDLVQPLRSD